MRYFIRYKKYIQDGSVDIRTWTKPETLHTKEGQTFLNVFYDHSSWVLSSGLHTSTHNKYHFKILLKNIATEFLYFYCKYYIFSPKILFSF